MEPAHLAPHAEIVAAAAVALAFAARFAGAVTTSGAVAGVVVAAGVAAGFGLPGFLVLAVFFVGGSIATKAGWKAKQERGTAEATGGARDWRRVVGKGGVAAALGVAAAYGTVHPAAFVGAMAAALGDTFGTEMGTLSTTEPRLLPSFRRVPHGTPGAVSLRGTLGVLRGMLYIVGSVFVQRWIADARHAPPEAPLVSMSAQEIARSGFGGFAGAMLESLVVGLIPAAKRVPGWVRNLFTTAAGGLFAWLLTGGAAS